MKLYELTNDYKEVVSMLDNEELDYNTFKDTMDAIKDGAEDKLENIVKVIKSIQAEESALADEIKRLTARKKAKQNQIASLKEYMTHNMESLDMQKVKTTLFTIYFANTNKVVIDDELAVPEQFVKTVREIQKRDVQAYLKENPMCEWAHMEASKSLNIR